MGITTGEEKPTALVKPIITPTTTTTTVTQPKTTTTTTTRTTSYPSQLSHQLEQEIIKTTSDTAVTTQSLVSAPTPTPTPTLTPVATVVEPSVEERASVFYQSLSPIEQQLVSAPTPTPTPTPTPSVTVVEPSTIVTPVPSTPFMELYAPGFVPISQRAETIGTGVIPEDLRRQISGISVPFAVETAGAGELYKQLSFEKYFLLPSYPRTEKSLFGTLERSYWYMSTQPVWGESGLTWGEVKAAEPALFLVKKPGGEWVSEFDVVRWRGEWEKSVGWGASAAVRAAEVPLFMFDVDLYFAQNKQEYLARRLYESQRSVVSGDMGRIMGTWGGLQVPAWSNVVLPFAGGAVFGHIFTGVKLAGGVARAGLGLRAAYGVGLVLGAETAVFTGSQIVSEFAGGESGKGFASVAKLGLQLGVGALGYGYGANIAMSRFAQQYPNVYWGSSGVPVSGKKFVSFQKEIISGKGLGGKTVVPYEYGFYKISQLYKPGRNVQQFITFPETVSPFGAKGDISTFFYTGVGRDLSTGVAIGTTRYFKTWWGGNRAFGYQAAWGVGKSEVIGGLGDVQASSIKGTLNVENLVRLQGKNVWADITATQTVVPGLKYFMPQMFLPSVGLVSPVFVFKPSISSFISPIGVSREIGLSKTFESYISMPVFDFQPKTRLGVVPVFKPEVSIGEKPVFVPQFSYKTVLKTITTPYFETATDVLPATATIPVSGVKTSLVSPTAMVTVAQTRSRFDFTPELIGPPVLPPLVIGGGRGAGSYPGGLGKRYLFREFKVIEDIFGLGKKKRVVKKGKRRR